MDVSLLQALAIEWGSALLRWLHVITGIAWIGSSFYFMHIDASLRKIPEIEKGGEAWEVHGGGFYQVRKHLVVPPELPAELIWHKWQSYSTWISGFFLLVWVYYAQSELYLIDPSVRELSPLAASAIGIGALALGWIVYDGLSRLLKDQDGLLAGIGMFFIMAACFLFQQVFSERGALIHTGALMATWMTFNVMIVIIPNQKKVIASLMAGEAPDPALGKQAKQRSTHNNYITLGVVFLMLSNHYPLTSSTPYAWAIAGCATLAGALVRMFYNWRHAGRGNQWWTWIAAALLLLLAAAISLTSSPQGRAALGLAAVPPAESRMASPAVPDRVAEIVQTRCAMCHAREPLWPGMIVAPHGVYLESAADILRHRHQVLVQSAYSHAMPPNNLAAMEPEERAILAKWGQSQQ
jgi:uncharacterized membrane protein